MRVIFAGTAMEDLCFGIRCAHSAVFYSAASTLVGVLIVRDSSVFQMQELEQRVVEADQRAENAEKQVFNAPQPAAGAIIGF